MSEEHSSSACLIVAGNKVDFGPVKMAVEALGVQAVCCSSLDAVPVSGLTIDLMIVLAPSSMQEHLSITPFDMYVRECLVPVLTLDACHSSLLTRYDTVHAFGDLDAMIPLITVLFHSHRRRRYLKEEQIKSARALSFAREIHFEFRSMEQAQAIAVLISTMVPSRPVLRLVLTELFLNAIEHGNLEIDPAEKQSLLQKGDWQGEIEDRLQKTPYKDRKISLKLQNKDNRLFLQICAEGNGYDWAKAWERDMDRGLKNIKQAEFDYFNFWDQTNVLECSICLEVS